MDANVGQYVRSVDSAGTWNCAGAYSCPTSNHSSFIVLPNAEVLSVTQVGTIDA
jgi:hypothetical protein